MDCAKPPAAADVLRLRQVYAAPWGSPLLHDIRLALRAGEILGVIGPNGAGKSSLLKMLAGEIAASGGDIHLLGAPLAGWTAARRARIMAVLPQHPALNFPFRVDEVILLGRTPHATGRRRDAQILTQVMEATDTAHLRERLYTQLSGGERQRVQIARVFAQIWQPTQWRARLLLLDEPTSSLDLAHQQLILESIRQLAATGCAIVLVAHDCNLVSAVAQRITAIKDGAQFATGAPAEMLSEALLSELFDARVSIAPHPETGRPLVIGT